MGDMSILGIGGRPSDPTKSAPTGDASKVADAPLRLTRQRTEAQWENVPTTEATSGSNPLSSRAPESTNEGSQPQTDEKDKKNNKLEDLPLKGAKAPTRPEREPYRGVQASGMAVQPTNVASAPIKEVDERRKKAAGEPDGTPSRADERPKQPSRRVSKALWAAVVLLALALAGVTGYGYLAVRQNGIALSQLPGMSQLLGTLQRRMDATEARLRDLAGDWSSLAEQVAALSTSMHSSLENARKHSEELILREQERIEAEMAEREQAINARLAQVESEQQAENKRLAQVQDWVQKNFEGFRQEIATQRENSGRDLRALRQDVGQSRSDIQSLAQKVEPQRVDFEAAKNKEQELVPGIALTVTRTDVRYQRFEGYLELMEDSRTLWLSKVAAQQAVPFYLKQGGQPYDLVVTTVNRNGVAGYLLVRKGISSERASGALGVGGQ